MKRGFTKPARLKVSGLWLVLGALLIMFGGYELYRWIVPFQTQNPFFHEVTIGQKVIDDWKYGAYDEEGYLRFYNGQQSIVLPPNTRTLDLDGKFVVIEKSTPSSLTYAEPLEAIPPKWFGILGVILFALCSFALWRIKRRPRKMRIRRMGQYRRTAEYMAALNTVKPRKRTKRFHAKIQRHWWPKR